MIGAVGQSMMFSSREDQGTGSKMRSVGHQAKAAVQEASAAGLDVPRNAQGMAASAIAKGAEPATVFAALVTPEATADDLPVDEAPADDVAVDETLPVPVEDPVIDTTLPPQTTAEAQTGVTLQTLTADGERIAVSAGAIAQALLAEAALEVTV